MSEQAKETVLNAEIEYVWASFASKIPLLALFWYTVANAEFGSTEFDVTAGIIVGVALFVAVTGVVYFSWFRGKPCTSEGVRGPKPPATIKDVEFFHGASGLLISAISIAMFIYIATINATEDENRAGTVINTFSTWTELPDGTFKLDQQKEVLGGAGSEATGVQLAVLPPVFSIISGIQHLITWAILHYSSDPEAVLFKTFGGAWFPRTVDYALSTPFIFLVNCFFFDNVISLFTIMLIFSTFGLLMFSGYASEVAWYDGKSGVQIYGPFVAGVVYFLLAWIPLGFQLEGSIRVSRETGGASPPWFVFVFVAWVFLSFLIFPWITLKKITTPSAVRQASYSMVSENPCLHANWKQNTQKKA